MAEVRVNIPEDLKLKFEEVTGIVWSIAAGRLIEERFEKIARLKGIASKSRLSEEKALELSDKISRSLAKRYESLKE